MISQAYDKDIASLISELEPSNLEIHLLVK